MRRVLICTADRSECGLLDPVMQEISKRDDVKADWCELDSQVAPEFNLILLRGILGAKLLLHENPDIVVVPTDRNEMVHVAAALFHMGYIVAHFHAGNNSTNHPDDLNRRAISLFSHIMFCNMPEHKENLVRQGEDPWRVYVVGSTAFDNIEYDDSATPKQPFDLVILHPNPTSKEKTDEDLRETIETVRGSERVVWIYPNHDRNHELIVQFLENNDSIFNMCTNVPVPMGNYIAFTKYKDLPRSQYLSLLRNCRRAIGNSSSFYYELPVINPRAKLIQIGERNSGLVVPKTEDAGAKQIAAYLATIKIDEELRNKKLTTRNG
jgi:GDP/UDP-N,N'-diacetylbacillosamine 2-epimerase (hydrolysing)